jgi:hypothetical protein
MKTIITGTLVLLSITVLCSFVLAQEKTRAVELKDLDILPPIYTKISKAKVTAKGEIKEPARYELVAKEQKAVNVLKKLKKKSQEEEKSGMTDPAVRAIYVVGGINLTTYYYIEIPFPSCLKDVDGGTIRLIMQHETDASDQVRIIDEHIGTEYDYDSYGRRGRNSGRYGWTRQSGGGDFSWILGDNSAHNLADPWHWAWIVDYRWGQGNSVLPRDVIRIYSHPHVTTRVIIKD